MSILAKYNKAMNDKDEAALRDIIHDDYTFTMHKSGTVLKKDDVVKWAMSGDINSCLLYTSPSPRDSMTSRMPSSA